MVYDIYEFGIYINTWIIKFYDISLRFNLI